MRLPNRPAIVVCWLLCTSTLWAQGAGRPIEIKNLRLGIADRAKCNHWTPIAFEVATRGVDFEGSVEAVTPDADGLPVSVVLAQARIARDTEQTVRGRIRLEQLGARVTILLKDRAGKTILSQEFADDSGGIAPKVFDSSAYVILGIGAPSGLQQMEADEEDPSSYARSHEVVVGQVTRVDDLPTDWFGYDGVDVLVLATQRQETLDAIDPARAEAMATWVRQGGHLVVSVASQWQTVKEGFLGKLLPADLTGVDTAGRLSPSVRALESLAGDKAPIEVGADGMTIATFTNVRGKPLPMSSSGTSDGAVAVRGLVGFGTVTLLGFDVNAKPFNEWPHRAKFWLNLLELPVQNKDEDQTWVRRSEITQFIDDQLQSFPSVTVVPFSVVAGLILGYILLIGPIDYYFLKRVVGKLEWTWFTFPVLVVLVSVGAYAAARQLKGDQLLVNRVELVDIDQTSQALRGRSFVSIFSPTIDRYTVTTEPSLGASGAWSEVAGNQTSLDRLCYTTGRISSSSGWGGPVATGLLGNQGYAYSSPDPTTVLEAPIPVWSVKLFASQWLAHAPLVIDTDLALGTLNDPTVLVGSITNRLKTPLSKAFLIWPSYAYDLGTLLPNTPKIIASEMQSTLSSLESAYPADLYDDGRTIILGSTGGIADGRTSSRSVRFLLDLSLAPRFGSKENQGAYNQVLSPWSLASQMKAGRAVILAQTDAPGAKLWINAPPQAGTEPPAIKGITTQTTLVRIVVEPKPAGETSR